MLLLNNLKFFTSMQTQELHDSHNNYPLACESMVIKRETTSNYNKKIIKNLEDAKIMISETTIPKLTPNLNDKKNYILNIRKLQTYLRYGLVLEKIHRGISFH